jgi:uncharacterized membrane protein YphA (DoxX/SURF4 family)
MLSHRLARPLLAGTFIVAGLDAVLHPDTKVGKAEAVTNPMTRALGLPDDSKAMVRANGGIQVGAGVLLAMGVLPRSMAASLAVSLVPTTLAGHAFWNEQSPTTRNAQRLQFLKNASMLGGLILAATDTDGRPSVSWRAHRAMGRMAKKIDDAAKKLDSAATSVASTASDRAAQAAHALPLPQR